MCRHPATVAAILLCLAGCCHPAAFRPARILPEGEVEHAIGLQYGLLLPYDSYERATYSGKGRYNALPAYALRAGLGDGFQLGFQVGLNLSTRFELTYQLLRSRLVDLALGADFGIETYLLKQGEQLAAAVAPLLFACPCTLAAPLILGLNPSNDLSIVLHAAPVLVSSFAPVEHLQFGAGLELRTAKLSWRPHVSVLAPLVLRRQRERSIAEGELLFPTGLLIGLDLAFGP